jgi:hypothetical protein
MWFQHAKNLSSLSHENEKSAQQELETMADLGFSLLK